MRFANELIQLRRSAIMFNASFCVLFRYHFKMVSEAKVSVSFSESSKCCQTITSCHSKASSRKKIFLRKFFERNCHTLSVSLFFTQSLLNILSCFKWANPTTSFFVLFSSFSHTIQILIEKSGHVRLGFELGASAWWAQTYPLSYPFKI